MKSEPELESAKHMTQTSTIFFKFCFYRSNIGKNENDPTSVGLGPRATISVPFLIPSQSLHGGSTGRRPSLRPGSTSCRQSPTGATQSLLTRGLYPIASTCSCTRICGFAVPVDVHARIRVHLQILEMPRNAR